METKVTATQEGAPSENDEPTMPALDWKCPRCEEAIAEWDKCPHCGWDPYPIIPDGWSIDDAA